MFQAPREINDAMTVEAVATKLWGEMQRFTEHSNATGNSRFLLLNGNEYDYTEINYSES